MTTDTETAADFDPGLRRLALVVALGAITAILDTTIVNVAINAVGGSFDTPLSTIQWVVTGYTLALSMTIPITGWAVERFGAKTMWLVALTLFAIGSVLCGVAWSATGLIASRVLQGIGGGLLMPVGQSMIAKAAGPGRMGRAMAVVAVPAMFAPVLGPVLGGLIIDHLHWRWLFFVNVPACALALALAVRLLPPDEERTSGGGLDVMGLALLSPGLAALVYGCSRTGGENGLADTGAIGGLAGGMALMAAFAAWSLRRRDRALLDLRIFRHRPFAASSAALFLYSAASSGLLILVPLYSQITRGGHALDAGLLIAPMGIGAIITMPLAGRLTDRLGSRGVGTFGIAVALAGAFTCTRVGPATPIWILLAALLVVGLGHGMIAPSLTAACYQGLPKTRISAATTMSNITMRAAASFGVAVLAVVLQSRLRPGIPGGDGSPALADAFSGSFWLVFAIAALALLPALLVPRTPPR